MIDEIKKDNKLYSKFVDMQKYYITPDFNLLDNKRIVDFLQIIQSSL